MAIDVILTAHPLSWMVDTNPGGFHGTQADRSLPNKKHRDSVLLRDDYTCQGCGFRSLHFMEIHHINHDHNNWRTANLATLCPLCHQVFHPNTASLSDGAYLAWVPEVSQVELNRLLLACFVVQRAGARHPFHQAADTFLRLMEARQIHLENQMLDSSRPNRYGQALLALREEAINSELRARTAAVAGKTEEARHAKILTADERLASYRPALEPIKMVARAARFENEIDAWRLDAEQKRTPEEWSAWAETVTLLESADPS
jgi:hypothetical protein